MPAYRVPLEAAQRRRVITINGASFGDVSVVVDPYSQGTSETAGYDFIEVTTNPGDSSVDLNVSWQSLTPGQEFWLYLRQTTAGRTVINWNSAFVFSGDDGTIPPSFYSSTPPGYLFHGILIGATFLMTRTEYPHQ